MRETSIPQINAAPFKLSGIMQKGEKQNLIYTT